MKIVDNRLFATFAVVFLIAMLLSVRLFYLQVWQHRYLLELAEQQINEEKISPVSRGEIRDRNNRILGVNVGVDSLAANPKLIENKKYFAEELSGILNISQEAILEKVNQNKCFVWIQRRIDPEVSAHLRKKQPVLEGLDFRKETKRYYPLGELLTTLVGVVGTDSKGLSGIELLYDKELTRKSSTEKYKRDGLKRELKVSYQKDSEYNKTKKNTQSTPSRDRTCMDPSLTR